MKPWQAKWYEFRRLKPGKENLYFAVLVCFAVGFILIAQSPKAARHEKALLLASNLGKSSRMSPLLAGEREKIEGLRSFDLEPGASGPDVYLFLPIKDGTLSALSAGFRGKNPFLQFKLHIIPRRLDARNPDSEALWQCVLLDPNIGASDLLDYVYHPTTKISQIKATWKKLSPLQLERLQKDSSSNDRIFEELGCPEIVIVGTAKQFKLKSWQDTDIVLSKLDDF